MSNVWLKLNHSLQHEYGTGCCSPSSWSFCALVLLPCVLTICTPLSSAELRCTACCDVIWPSFGTNASFTIQFTSVLFSLAGVIKVVPLGNNIIANKSKWHRHLMAKLSYKVVIEMIENIHTLLIIIKTKTEFKICYRKPIEFSRISSLRSTW